MAADYLLVIDGIKGESLDDQHPNSIEVLSFAWGHANNGSASAGSGAGTGKVKFKDITFHSYVNTASPDLAQACANGKHFKKAQLFVRKQGFGQQDYYVITLDDFIVSSFDSSVSASPLPMDVFTFNFAKVRFEYRRQNPDGTIGAPITMTWNLKTNAAQ